LVGGHEVGVEVSGGMAGAERSKPARSLRKRSMR
jgi:hypothetical protein